jgi:hypothetical protein
MTFDIVGLENAKKIYSIKVPYFRFLMVVMKTCIAMATNLPSTNNIINSNFGVSQHKALVRI